MRRLRLAIIAVALTAPFAGPVLGQATGQPSGQPSGQAGALDCRGTMVVPNQDGSSVTYDMQMRFADGTYRIEALSRDTGEVTQDEGACTDVMMGCRHEFVDADGAVADFYNFGLEAGDAGMYRYRETWADGATADVTLECRRAGVETGQEG